MIKYIFFITYVMITLIENVSANETQNHELTKFFEEFTQKYQELEIPGLQLSYVSYLHSISSKEDLEKQSVFFQKYAKRLESFEEEPLTLREQMNCMHLSYEIELNLERISLELKFLNQYKDMDIPTQGLYEVPMAKAWYQHFLRRWLSIEISPEELKEFGRREIRKVQQQIQEVQKELGFEKDSAAFYKLLNSEKFLWKDKGKVVERYKEIDQIVRRNISQLFYPYTIPLIRIAPIPDVHKDSPPGFYNSSTQTFYFNFFKKRHRIRNMDFLYIHEAIPGHHFQGTIARDAPGKAIFGDLFRYNAFGEGWAAYCEELGKSIGLYETSYAYLGKLEWDLVRSVRVVLDVGLNYEGWSREKALQFWKANISNQDAIAEREIDRILRWPVQVITYKVGAAKIMELKEYVQHREGKNFQEKDFHQLILEGGNVPLEVLEKSVKMSVDKD